MVRLKWINLKQKYRKKLIFGGLSLQPCTLPSQRQMGYLGRKIQLCLRKIIIYDEGF